MYRIGLIAFLFMPQLSQARGIGEPTHLYESAAEAFQFVAKKDKDGIMLKWKIASCCKLYIDKIKVRVSGSEISHEAFQLLRPYILDNSQPEGYEKVAIGDFWIRIPKSNGSLDVTYQGCNSLGFCYPPQRVLLQGESW